jgi:prepilin-type N-terminal cleavage/methylation domain-containing protein
MAVFTAAPIPAAPTSSARKGCATGAAPGRKAAGFSLIELMIVLVVLGILVAVAVPSYRNSIARSQRVDAQSALLGFSQAMERFFTQNYTFEGAAAGGNATGVPLGTVFSAVAPIDGDAIYNLSTTAHRRATVFCNWTHWVDGAGTGMTTTLWPPASSPGRAIDARACGE